MATIVKRNARAKQLAGERRDEASQIQNAKAGNIISLPEGTPDMASKKARRVVPEVLYDGAEVGLTERLESLSYTDNDQGRVDEITLTFSDANAAWMMKEWIPEKGHDLDVSLYFMDWNAEGEKLKYHCGNFTVDDLSYSGPPWTCTIKGVAILAESDIQTELKSKTWENVTLKQIVLEKMAIYGMPPENLYWSAAEPIIAKVEQSNKSDATFLKDLCEKQGCYLKLYKKGMVVFDKHVYEPRPAKAGFGIADIEGGSLTWNNTLNGTYTGAILSYTNPSKKKNTGAEKTLTVQVGDCGEGARILRLNQHVEDEAEAQRIAIAKLNQANEKGCTVTFTAMANVTMYATDNFMLSGLGRLDGKYYCSSVTHTLSRSGHRMTISGYKVWGRL